MPPVPGLRRRLRRGGRGLNRHEPAAAGGGLRRGRLARRGSAGPYRVHPAGAVRLRGRRIPAGHRLGLRPQFLLGHSVGELAAAHVAGVLSLADAATLVAARARLMQQLPPGGAMLAVQASEAEVVPLLDERVSLAAVNGPRSVVLSGDEEAVLAAGRRLSAEDRRSRRLRVSHAFHSARMDAMLADFRIVAEKVAWHPPNLPIVSDRTGERSPPPRPRTRATGSTTSGTPSASTPASPPSPPAASEPSWNSAPTAR
ncbi:acyltransferase domain-containing protein [Micromonospora sp. BRA006-A]|nr:acyltransferase domain-containing protein [Micromonospora sp. BRA006-A]